MTDSASARSSASRHAPLRPGTVSPAQALQWLAAGWRLFTANPGVWVAQALILIVILTALGFVPLIGWAAAPVALPVLLAGMVAGARSLDEGGTLRVDHLFEGLKRHAGNLLMVGGFYLLGGLVAGLVAAAIGGSALLTGMMTGSAGGAGMAMGGMMLGMLVFSVLWGFLMMALWFAPALVMLQDVAPLDAMKLSVQACLGNLLTFVVLAVMLFVLGWIAMLPAGLGTLVLIPVLAGALLAAWRDTFGVSPAPAAIASGEG